jgi:hypothetical protein
MGEEGPLRDQKVMKRDKIMRAQSLLSMAKRRGCGTHSPAGKTLPPLTQPRQMILLQPTKPRIKKYL